MRARIIKKLSPGTQCKIRLAAIALSALLASTGWAWNFNHNGDFDGDGLMDPTVYCEATGEWRALLVSNDYEPVYLNWGGPGWTAIQSDYDGDERADLLIYHRASGAWNVMLSGSGYASAQLVFGGEGWVVVTGDFDGDRKTDPAIYNEALGEWRILLSGAQYKLDTLSFGAPGCTAVSGDYDGDGISDPGVYRRADGQWLIQLSSQSNSLASLHVDAMGDGPLVPIPFDYDGDGKTDPALFAYSCDSTIGKSYVFGWYLTYSSQKHQPIEPFYHVGRADCQPSNADPTPGDYDGDGQGDYAVTWPDASTWRMWRSSHGLGNDHCVDDWHVTGFRPVQR